MEQISLIADFIGILGSIFAFLAWVQARQIDKKIEQERKRQNKKLKLFFVKEEELNQFDIERMQ